MAGSWPLDHQGTPSVWEIASGDLWYGTGARLHALWQYEGPGGREVQEGGDRFIYRQPIHFIVQQRLRACWQAIIFQSKTQPRKRQRPWGCSHTRRNSTCRHSKKLAIGKQGREASPETNVAGTLILDFQPPELRGNTFLLFVLPSLWYLVVAAPAGWYRPWDKSHVLRMTGQQD